MKKMGKILMEGILISALAIFTSFGIQKANAGINAGQLRGEALTVNGVTLIPDGGVIELPEFVPGQILRGALRQAQGSSRNRPLHSRIIWD